jgi:hypothetical protein
LGHYHAFRGPANAAIIGSGGMAEWLKAAVLKTDSGCSCR